MRTAFLLLLLLLGLAPASAAGLYTCTVIVTGKGEESRPGGFARCLTEVLVKVSGDFRLAADPRVVALDAAAMVTGFRYRDRMAGIPVHDEQGSRDRPYDLTVDFDSTATNAALASLGRMPWTAPRPTLAVLVEVSIADQTFALLADGDRGRDMRDALAAAAEKAGLVVRLPATDELSGPAAQGAEIDAVRASDALAGRLVWDDAALGWTADWQLVEARVPHRWQIRGVSFDEAFRSGLGGAALILSGNGAPD